MVELFWRLLIRLGSACTIGGYVNVRVSVTAGQSGFW
jgi:hypothetical protein